MKDDGFVLTGFDVAQLEDFGGCRTVKGFRDEALRGEWAGYRSSRLGLQYRVIYRIEKDEILVEVIDITPHDYRKK